MIQTLKKCNKKMGSPCLFTRQQALKMGYFYWLRVKNSNHLHTEFSLGNLKDTKFYFEIKVSFIKINSIASCYLFLIAWLWGFCTFRAVPWRAVELPHRLHSPCPKLQRGHLILQLDGREVEIHCRLPDDAHFFVFLVF